MTTESGTKFGDSVNEPKVLLLVNSNEQKRSLQDNVRMQILGVLSKGVIDFRVDKKTESNTLEDGTNITHLVEVKKPVTRYWMSVPEIAAELREKNSDTFVTNYQCYYHLQKLRNQGLVVQNPAPEFNPEGTERRIRGKQFRTAARFFITNHSSTSLNDFTVLLEFLERRWGVRPSERARKRLRQIITEQDELLFDALEHLVSQMDTQETDDVTLPYKLERLAHLYLSNNEEFIERYNEARHILVQAGGTAFDIEGVMNAAFAEGTSGGQVDEQYD
ncbi:MAG: hypothetical protein EAX95_12100 [Candidatus Thorarchaeota archaeon]|nr:hypothetical protein [Candidatus Thorarchaeota archaeon]